MNLVEICFSPRLQFWVVYCAWCVLELFLDNILFYMPLYPEVKMAIVAGLIFGGGATKIYDPYIYSFLIS